MIEPEPRTFSNTPSRVFYVFLELEDFPGLGRNFLSNSFRNSLAEKTFEPFDVISWILPRLRVLVLVVVFSDPILSAIYRSII